MVPVKLTSIFLKRMVEKNEGILHISFVKDLNSETRLQRYKIKKLVSLHNDVTTEHIEPISSQISCSYQVIANHPYDCKIDYQLETGNGLSFHLEVDGHF